MLYLRTPHGQRECKGAYDLVPTRSANGRAVANSRPNCMRLWKQRDGDCYIFGSIKGGWSVAGEAARQYRFTTGVSMIASLCAHEGKWMPHELPGDWKRLKEEGGGWVLDTEIRISTSPFERWEFL